jgi:uncharacterized protein DUF4238
VSDTPHPVAEDQHYVPRFYLKGFTDKSKVLWVCEQGKPIRPSNPKHEAHRPDYYTHQEEGERDTTAEDVLKQAESVVAPTVRKLANPQFELTPKAQGDLYFFVALMFARVPAWRDYLDQLFSKTSKKAHVDFAKSKEKFYESMERFEKERGTSLGMEYEELRQFVLSGKYIIEQTSVRYKLGTMFQSALSIVEMLREFDYDLLYTPPKTFFMTSDCPVLTILRQPNNTAYVGAGFGWPETEVYFPLNKRVCLKLRRKIRRTNRLMEQGEVDNLNRAFMAAATRYLYTSQRLRKTARLFDEFGCKSRAGTNAFMLHPADASMEQDYSER